MNTTMKKAFVVLTTVSCLMGGASIAAAEQVEIMPISAPITAVPISAPIEAVPISAPVYEIGHSNLLPSVRVYGQAAKIEEKRILLENNNENDALSSVIVNISEDTRILNAVTGMPMKLEDIRENETLYAYVGPAMTRSLPPMAHAELILAGIPADFAVPTFAEIERVTRGEDGSVVIGTNRDAEFAVTADTTLSPYLTMNIITPEMLVPGQKVLVWESAAIDGEQAANVADKVMVFPYGYKGYVSANLDGISVNGDKVELSEGEAPFAKDGQLMLPLRKVAEALGYEIKWNAETRNIEVVSGEDVLYSLKLRGTEVTTADGETRELRAAAALEGGNTFLAADDLIDLNEIKYVEQ
ncbi:copper amine oxidase-like protein [Paenibacillus cellulosilyticus]|uniref:Copper amine oxidase-like protein n=1 Tax=Paenibacillus cellulosilyticus TaxID=375489 RepID=A0A2V2YPT3_9BACL|nr:copper amine oxidase N-terminal domain-containing protein [Paenibacillus cellulosilyticus]PWV98520.1 copper amine oxidase-like protein [Paenibacillus cellulosilyticus]QKS44128.1 copper amine oxidase N-terminal domain-containing protein [Paenibacillus cellulosilyticus]